MSRYPISSEHIKIPYMKRTVMSELIKRIKLFKRTAQ